MRTSFNVSNGHVGFACCMAFLIGACSGGSAPGIFSSGGGGGDPVAASASGSDSAELIKAKEAYSEAEAAVGAALMAARATTDISAFRTAAAGMSAARGEAKRLIVLADEMLDAAVAAAEAAVATAEGAAALGAAARALGRANDLRRVQRTRLRDARLSLAWYSRDLVRYAFASGEVAVPREGANVATIRRIPRTIPGSDGTQVPNPDAFTSDTFKDVMYADGKRMFSVVDDDAGGDEFRVDGYIGWRASSLDTSTSMHAGIKLTNAGLVIRTGGTGQDLAYDNSLTWDSSNSKLVSDYTDTRRNITTWANDGDGDGVPETLYGQNGWDLEIAFDEPKTRFAGGRDTSWTGNGDFYWKSVVRADPSQLNPNGAYYDPRAFGQTDGYKDLGTYEVWLSNHIGLLARNLEPSAGSGTVTCPDGSRGAACPYDDTHHYLKYAAYGLFIYAPDLETFRGIGRDEGYNGHVGRNHTLHFGYSAFGTGAGQKTKDIGEAVTDGEFRGHTLAYEILGDSNLERAGATGVETRLLRGDVALTVNIPKGSGLGTVEGSMSNFQEWDEENGYWISYVGNFAVDLETVVISESGTFTGKVRAEPSAGFGSDGAGNYKGSFYGPRADADDLEIAGSWQVGAGQADDGLKDIYGSFGAKQRPTAAP